MLSVCVRVHSCVRAMLMVACCPWHHAGTPIEAHLEEGVEASSAAPNFQQGHLGGIKCHVSDVRGQGQQGEALHGVLAPPKQCLCGELI